MKNESGISLCSVCSVDLKNCPYFLYSSFNKPHFIPEQEYDVLCASDGNRCYNLYVMKKCPLFVAEEESKGHILEDGTCTLKRVKRETEISAEKQRKLEIKKKQREEALRKRLERQEEILRNKLKRQEEALRKKIEKQEEALRKKQLKEQEKRRLQEERMKKREERRKEAEKLKQQKEEKRKRGAEISLQAYYLHLGGLYVCEVAKRLKISNATASRIIKKMKEEKATHDDGQERICD